MKAKGPDKGTESFYQIEKVAEEYETIRFEHPGGRLSNALQQGAVVEGIGAADLTGNKVLDVACGTGRFSRLFRTRGAKVVGLDLSRAMLKQADSRHSADAYVEASALQLPFKDKAFDIAISVNAFNHIPAFEDAIGEICRVSKKVILGLPHRNSVLLLAYLYRMMRGWGARGTRHKTERYQGAPVIYTLYFSTKELERIFAKNHFDVVRCPKSRMFPFPYVPGSLVKVVEVLEKAAARCFGRYGTFMAMVAERRRHGK
jgi:ubiquinone/menaquinone biosynthesis C-methylase UbiE